MFWTDETMITYRSTATNAKRADFGHINPDAIKVNLVMIGNHFIYPPRTPITKPVGEDCVTRPDFTYVETPIGIGQEGTSSSIASGKWSIPVSRSASERINKD